MFQDNTPIFEFRGPWGVPVQIGGSLLLLALILIDFDSQYTLVYSVMYFAIVIGSIYVHELGHAWGCLIQGVPVRRVMIYGGGGFCEQSRSATRYESELIVAMGPIVNLTLWAVAGLLYPAISDPEMAYFVWLVCWVNGFLAVMNLMPVHPLDGGKLFELMLHRVMPARMAIWTSASLGLVLSVIWVPLMIWCFLTFGLVLFFFPSIRFHWQMLQSARLA